VSTRRATALLAAAALAFQPGCATPPPSAQSPTLGRFAVVASAAEPEIRFEGFSRGQAAGAARGAGTGFLACAAGLGYGTCAGPYCGALVMVWLAICGTAAAVGGVAGAAASSDAATVKSAEAALATAISSATIQEALRAQLARSVAQEPGYRRDAGEGVDTLVEVGLLHAGTYGSGYDSPLVLSMQARVRLLRRADNAVLRSLEFGYEGPALRLQEWAAQNGEPLVRALALGYERLGAELADNLLRLYPFPDRGHQSGGLLAVAFGLAPVYPAMRGSVSSEGTLQRRAEWLAVDGLRPELRWQAFPREADREAAPDDLARVRNVTYDLVIARERHLVPAEVVYRRERLERAAHRLETELQPGAFYYWSVRARFELDGRERVTEWSTAHWFAFGRLTSLSRWSYRFRTPGS
jgi:hypothetical protein